MSKQEDFCWPKKPLEKTREIDNEARISKKAEMKRKFNRNQKRITLWDIQLSSLLTTLITITSKSLKPIQNFLENRFQKAILNKNNIFIRSCTLAGVPLGSILEALLFLIYINDCMFLYHVHVSEWMVMVL